ncbi:hypothetical protein V866_002715 [Kwoniella sp. B9012]
MASLRALLCLDNRSLDEARGPGVYVLHPPWKVPSSQLRLSFDNNEDVFALEASPQVAPIYIGMTRNFKQRLAQHKTHPVNKRVTAARKSAPFDRWEMLPVAAFPGDNFKSSEVVHWCEHFFLSVFNGTLRHEGGLNVNLIDGLCSVPILTDEEAAYVLKVFDHVFGRDPGIILPPRIDVDAWAQLIQIILPGGIDGHPSTIAGFVFGCSRLDIFDLVDPQNLRLHLFKHKK